MKKSENTHLKETAKKLLEKVSKYKVGLIVVIVFVVLRAIIQVITMFLLGNTTDIIVDGISGGLILSELIKAVVVLGISYLLSIILDYLQQALILKITNKFIYNLRKEVQGKLKRLPLAYYDNTPTGDILSVVTNDIDTLGQSFRRSVPNFFSAILTLVITFIGMLLINVKLTLIGIVTIPLSILASLAIMKFSQKYFIGRQQSMADIGGFIEENFTGHEIIKSFNQENKATAEFGRLNQELYRNSKWSQFAASIAFPLSNFFGNLSYVAIIVVGGFQILINPTNLSVGNLQTFINLLRQFINPIAQLTNMLNDIQSALAGADRIFAYLEATEETPEIEPTQTIKNINGIVDLEDVQFSYLPGQPIIKHLRLKVNSGERVAIVGPTGAGKTTLVNLLMRFYDVDSGEILIDDVNINNMKRSDLRSMFGMVLQDTWLFRGTVKDNIRYGKLNATDEEVIAAAKKAYVEDFVCKYPDGYDMVIEEDASNISSGQRQLVTIARALLSDPEILILDEATSAVDTRTEIHIQKAMDELMKNRTSFVIAHRLSTIKDSKTILVMDNGEIVESGSHEELLERDGFYKKLYDSQYLD